MHIVNTNAVAYGKDLFLMHFIKGTSHDWRLRCDAVDVYHTLFGLSRPSCLPLPELGLVLNLKEKKTVLNPIIIPETGISGQEPLGSANVHGIIPAFQIKVSKQQYFLVFFCSNMFYKSSFLCACAYPHFP